MIRFLIPALMALSCGAGAEAYTHRPQFDPAALKRTAPGAANEIAVLGTPHISALPSNFDPSALRPLLDRLAAWHPQVITVEALSGLQCDFMRRYPARYSETIDGYCWNATEGQKATGLDIPAAATEVDRLLASWPVDPTPGQRRRLAALYLAAGEPGSALVQWLRLAEVERHQGDSLNAALVEALKNFSTRRDETMLVAAPLAARLGLDRLYPVDDHTADAVIADEKAYGDAITKAWNNPATKERSALDATLFKGIGSGAGVLALYRAYNAPKAVRLAYDSDFGAALNEPSAQGFGRGYVGYWETRNLRIASNIRDILGLRPGVRALVLIGASHKGYLEAYLDEMHDVKVIDTATLLGSGGRTR